MQVEAFFASSGADLRLSYGAFYDNRLIGFMVNACSVYNGERAVFDVATGVVPELRDAVGVSGEQSLLLLCHCGQEFFFVAGNQMQQFC